MAKENQRKIKMIISEKFRVRINKWAMNNYLNIGIFNVFVIIMFLLYSAGYFHPFFPITINFIVFSSLVVSIFLFKANSRSLFLVSLVFWIFAGVIRLLGVGVWAERTAIYSYQALVLGSLLLVYESLKKNNGKKK